MESVDKVVVVTRRTRLEELVERFNTRLQARFWVEHMGVPFTPFEEAHEAYHHSLDRLKRELPTKIKRQRIDRELLPIFAFGERDLVVTLGPDGLVVNTAKYLDRQPIVPINPDPARVDGILNPLAVGDLVPALEAIQGQRARIARVSMACASLNTGQTLFAVNDLFIGHRSHQAARYALGVRGAVEEQCSSGIIVSTGAGSTGWLRSILVGALAVSREFCGVAGELPSGAGRFDWEDEELRFFVREPFPSRTSTTTTVCGRIAAGETIRITSSMGEGGVIFSDGIETDFLPFGAGTVATIGISGRKAHLVQRSW